MVRVLSPKRGILLLVLVAIPAWPSAGHAQMSARVRGTVLDVDGQPVEGATVTFEYQGGLTRQFEATTNGDGDYMQMGLQPLYS